MKAVIPERYTAQMDDSFVVFVSGMRINRPFAVSKWLPVAREMGGMLKELYENKELGFLGTESFFNGRTTLQIQYWKSFEALEHYACHASFHVETRKNPNLKSSKNESVGIFHETYVIEKGQYESVYVNMPRFGLAKAGESIPVNRQRETAQARMKS